jgi:uncharacterized repeat protein (TIGR01451 family)
MSRGRRSLPVAAIAGTIVATALAVVVPATPVAAVTPLPNPTIADSCGVDTTLVLDASGSINSSHAVEQVRAAAQAFLDALKDTRSRARVTQFATVSAELAPSTLVDGTSLGPGGVLTNALAGYYNPIPPRPPGVTFHQYKGSGTPFNANSWNAGSSTQYTNWDQSLKQAGAQPSRLVVYVTDGDPTAYDFRGSAAGDPFPAGDVGYSTDSGQAAQVTIDRAVEAANGVKTKGARMLAVGVGAALGSGASQQRLQQISGPQIVRDADLANITSLNQVDVALVTDFEDLAAFLRSVVLQLCSPSLTIRKLAQSASSATYAPAQGWSITATPTTTSGNFNWILPDTTPATSKTLPTDADGFAQFQWEPVPSNATSSATVSEARQPGFTPGRPPPPPDTDFRCELRDEKGTVRVVEGELTVTPTTASFNLPDIRQEIVTCTLWNSFDYDPAIALTKVNDPPSVRGDLTPPATVTSTYEVTNPGNTPLRNVTVLDDKCAPVSSIPASGPNVGDANQDGLLDVGEAWRFQCTRSLSVSRRAAPVPTTIVNTATASGIDPAGTRVTDTATDDVVVWVPRISLTKLVAAPTATPPVPPADAITVTAGTQVTYTYAVTNEGNTPLSPVVLTDDTPPCTNPTRDPPGTDTVLDPGETFTYSCTATPTDPVTNTATVTGTPLDPTTGNPFTGRNPDVTANDDAEVELVNPGITLTKSADPDVVLLGPNTPSEPVLYTFVATNTGDTPLNRPGASSGGPGTKDPGWVADSGCSPVTYFSGDDGNDLLDPGESWTFTCTRDISQRTPNLAVIVGQPSNPDGTPLDVPPVVDAAVELVDVLRPGIDIVKTALVPVVLDPDAAPVSGPDVPDVRPAEYLYDVTNTGNVPLDLNDENGELTLTDTRCTAITPVEDPAFPGFNSGDTNQDELLDVDETWEYTCSTTLEREQGTPPPQDESGLVTNVATVTGVPFFEEARVPDKSVGANDQAQVLVIEPSLTIEKSASPTVVLPGGDVTYTFVVRNTGDVGLNLFAPEDDKCAPLVPVEGSPGFNVGDINRNGLLDGADSAAPESWTYTCTRPVPMPADGATEDVNTVTVQGIDPLDNVYEAAANASVRVFDPAIHLEKTVDQTLVPPGTTVNYDFAVTNVGTSPIAADDVLAQVVLADASLPATPTCDSPTFVGGDDGDGLLSRDPPEVWTYRCSAPIDSTTVDVAVVRGTGGTTDRFVPPQPVDVFDVAAALVTVFHPAITVTKTASPTTLLGSGPVTYTYAVRNTGDVPLADVASRITDDRCAPLTYVSGDQDGDGLLDTPNSIFEDALDETWTFTCTTTISATTTNTVVVTGTPTDPGGVHLCGATPAVAEFAAAQAEASPAPCDVTANANATVAVIDPGTVVITKRTTEPTTARFAFSFNVPPAAMPPGACDASYPTTCIPPAPPRLNCSDITARAFTVLPPDPHGFDGDGDGVGCEDDAPVTLGRDDSFTLRNVVPGTYVVTEPTAQAWRLASVVCTDPTGDSVVTLSERQASIVVAPGETVRCEFTNRPSGELPATGNSQLSRSLATGVTLIGLGSLLVALRRRRRRTIPG